MKTPLTEPEPLRRRATVYREFVRDGRATSLLATEIFAPSSPRSPALLASQMATRYFGTLSLSFAGLVTASATEEGGSDAASCGFVLHPSAAGRLPLIRLDGPRMKSRPGHARLTYPIAGGLLVRTAVDHSGHSGSGSFSFEVMVAGASTTFAVRVDDFAARILGCGTSLPRRLLYQGTESLVHRVWVAGFLREFVGSLPS